MHFCHTNILIIFLFFYFSFFLSLFPIFMLIFDIKKKVLTAPSPLASALAPPFPPLPPPPPPCFLQVFVFCLRLFVR